MRIDLKEVFQLEGFEKSFETSIDLSGLEICGGFPFKQPVALSGRVRNQNMVVSLRFHARTAYEASCDRCLEEVRREFDYSFDHILTDGETGDETGEIIPVSDFRLDIDELAREDILLAFPTKLLCGEDCLGLCQKCGQNLNYTQCGCAVREIDPRWAALEKLL